MLHTFYSLINFLLIINDDLKQIQVFTLLCLAALNGRVDSTRYHTIVMRLLVPRLLIVLRFVL